MPTRRLDRHLARRPPMVCKKNSPNFPSNITTMRPEIAGQPYTVFRRNVSLLAGTWTPFLMAAGLMVRSIS